MKLSIFSSLTLLLSVLCLSLSAQEELRDNATGAVFPSEVTFQQGSDTYKLHATGVATRKKFFVNVYSVAHYLQDSANNLGTDKIQLIMQDNFAKQLTMKWARNVEAAKIQEGYQESFKTTLSNADYSELQNEINRFIQLFNQEAQKGDEYILRWTPGGNIEVLINGKKAGSFTNKAFAKALWNIWFGDKSVVDRSKLVSLMK